VAVCWREERTCQKNDDETCLLKGKGFILVIDYGDKARALYTDYRRSGTLACYYRHQMNELPLALPGQQDITAHVNFSALIEEGRRHGLRLHTFTTQQRWLENMGIYEELDALRKEQFAEADTDRASDRGQIALFKWHNLRNRVAALTDPTGMGNFKVLVMRR
jgi:SAM-dependent MidA family methyltransferase